MHISLKQQLSPDLNIVQPQIQDFTLGGARMVGEGSWDSLCPQRDQGKVHRKLLEIRKFKSRDVNNRITVIYVPVKSNRLFYPNKIFRGRAPGSPLNPPQQFINVETFYGK